MYMVGWQKTDVGSLYSYDSIPLYFIFTYIKFFFPSLLAWLWLAIYGAGWPGGYPFQDPFDSFPELR
jgi:hypothetical protein